MAADGAEALSWVWWGALVVIAQIDTVALFRSLCYAAKSKPTACDSGTLLATATTEPSSSSSKLRRYERVMKCLAIPYVFECIYRCYWPADYPSRTVFWDTIFNSVLLERCMAAVGESCFTLQFTLALRWISLELEAHTPARRPLLLPLRLCAMSTFCVDIVSQSFSVWGCITGNQFGFYMEGIFWAYMFGMWCLVSLSLLFLASRTPEVGSCGGRSSAATLMQALTPIGVVIFCYQTFIYTPECYNLWQADVDAGKTYPGIAEGALEALTHRVPTKLWSFWASQVVWQTMYFSLGAWTSIWLMRAPRLDIRKRTQVEGALRAS